MIRLGGLSALLALGVLALATWSSMQPIGPDFRHLNADSTRLQILDREGTPLSVTYRNDWNLHDVLPLSSIPEMLQQAFILAEDQRFRSHHGVDWAGRFNALALNLRHGRAIRGASTLSEQVVRMLHPRPRTVWSRWVEGFEAASLERQTTKSDILEFYLNQVPYAHHWRGVQQAAHGYFHRDLDTLSVKEMLTLAVLVRAPSALDPERGDEQARLERSVLQLAGRLHAAGLIDDRAYAALPAETLELEGPALPVEATHFVQYVRRNAPSSGNDAKLRTTLDSTLQQQVSQLLDERLKLLGPQHVENAAALVVDHTTNEVLAWAVAGADDPETPGQKIDAVDTPRQPGSAMKPFLYAAALDKGWTASTLIEDSPLENAVGNGLHAFNNYSRRYHGFVPLREALANSLNIPAVRTIDYVGVAPYLALLHRIGFDSLSARPDFYDEGLALGNGGVTLLELVEGYTALAHQGRYRPLVVTLDQENGREAPVFSPEAASLIGNILSDPYARQWEFGENSVLNLPVQTAVKTGTSTDYRDAWAVGYNDRYVVGIWMGNLDNTAMDGVTGSIGPSLTLRSIFSELNQGRQTQGLPLSPRLVQRTVCLPINGRQEGPCAERAEYFLPGHGPETPAVTASAEPKLEIARPTEGLQLAYDPRIPADLQAFNWEIRGLKSGEEVEWFLNGERVARSPHSSYLWPVTRGHYELTAFGRGADGSVRKTGKISFIVK